MAYLLENHPALGTSWWIEVFGGVPATDVRLQTAIIATIEAFAARYSRFAADSEVTRLNHERALHHPDQALIDILSYGQGLFGRTSGYFNLLLGETLEARGYDSQYSFTPTKEPLTLPDPRHDLVITPELITQSRGKIDLGGFGKGYLIDILAAQLQENGVPEFLINGGGDLYGTSEHGNPITVYLEHPTEPETYLGTTTLYHQGFAASSPFKRVWQYAGQAYDHIVGHTEQPLASFVIAKTARDADAFATMVLLASEDELATAVTKEGFSYARFNPATSEFTRTNFPFSPL